MSCDNWYRRGCDNHQAGHCSMTARERPAPEVHPTDSIRRDTPHLEGSFSDTESGALPNDNLGARRQYHR
jgi:hypothetical protein